MRVKMFLGVVILLVSTSFVFAISVGEGEGDTVLDLTSVGGSEVAICDPVAGEWDLGGESLGCENDGEICCPAGLLCIEDSCVESVVSTCGVFETQPACAGGSPDPNFIYETVAGELIEQGIEIEVDDLIDSDFCVNENSIFSYEDDGLCVVLNGPCACEWIDSECVDTNAEIRAEREEGCDGIDEVDDATDVDGSEELICEKATGVLENLCSTQGFYLLEWTGRLVETDGTTASPSTSPSCDNGERTFSCLAEGVEVPFFTMMNFFMSLIFIVGIYMVIVMFKRR